MCFFIGCRGHDPVSIKDTLPVAMMWGCNYFIVGAIQNFRTIINECQYPGFMDIAFVKVIEFIT